MNLKNKKVIITGATGGIGNSLVKKFTDNGAIILATGTKEEKLNIEWAGEIIERKWSKASKGGVRPGNQPMGHTAFLLIATKLASDEEE